MSNPYSVHLKLIYCMPILYENKKCIYFKKKETKFCSQEWNCIGKAILESIEIQDAYTK